MAATQPLPAPKPHDRVPFSLSTSRQSQPLAVIPCLACWRTSARGGAGPSHAAAALLACPWQAQASCSAARVLYTPLRPPFADVALYSGKLYTHLLQQNARMQRLNGLATARGPESDSAATSAVADVALYSCSIPETPPMLPSDAPICCRIP